MTDKHFLDICDLDAATLRAILDDANAHKAGKADYAHVRGKALAMIFEKPSTRTRFSFELGMKQMDAHVVVTDPDSSQLGRGETIADTARVLSRYVDIIMIRTDDPQKMHDLAFYATVPVVNGLTDFSHPCQVMADVMTVEERRGPIAGQQVAWCGDGNNMAVSWVHAAERFKFSLKLACPDELCISREVRDWALERGADVELVETAADAAENADIVVTDTWVSMGDADAERRHRLLQPFQVNEHLMAIAKPDAIFMHCLPAHRGEEVTDAVIDGPQSVVWDEAENRLHVQKAIVSWCLKDEA